MHMHNPILVRTRFGQIDILSTLDRYIMPWAKHVYISVDRPTISRCFSEGSNVFFSTSGCSPIG